MKLFFYLGHFLIIFALISYFISVFGFMRFRKNTYIQIHISGITDIFAFPILLIGISLLNLFKMDFYAFLKIIFTAILVYVANPITNYCVIKIVYFYSSKKDYLKNITNTK